MGNKNRRERREEWIDKIDVLQDEFDAGDKDLSQWECEFLASVREQLENDKDPTEAQEDKLDEILDR